MEGSCYWSHPTLLLALTSLQKYLFCPSLFLFLFLFPHLLTQSPCPPTFLFTQFLARTRTTTPPSPLPPSCNHHHHKPSLCCTTTLFHLLHIVYRHQSQLSLASSCRALTCVWPPPSRLLACNSSPPLLCCCALLYHNKITFLHGYLVTQNCISIELSKGEKNRYNRSMIPLYKIYTTKTRIMFLLYIFFLPPLNSTKT